MATDRDALDELATVSRMDAIHEIKHYLYMPTEELAREAMLAVLARDFEVVEEPYLNLDAWSVVVKTQMVPEEEAIVALRKVFTEIAGEHDGEYDGWEAKVEPLTDQVATGDGG